MINRIGFTGTQDGMTPDQKSTFRELVKGAIEFHHGDCVGADSDAHDIVDEMDIEIVIHPPAISKKRAYKKAPRILPRLPYLDRNRNIVVMTNQLIATPREYNEQKRSGTWSTIRVARSLNRRIYIIQPNGTLKVEG